MNETSTKLVELISATELSLEIGISEETLYRWVKLGVFPKPLRVGLREFRWLKKTVNGHFEKLAEEANNAKE
jgi:predicted DNA-binding transcriptional regulator AlpA